MRTNRFCISFLVALLLVPAVALSQTHSITSTTLSSAVTDKNADQIKVASATGISAGTLLYVDREAMRVKSSYVSGTTIPVSRGDSGTLRTTHASGRTVQIGNPEWFQRSEMAGSCTLASLYVHPWINLVTGNQWECLSSQWVITNGPLSSGAGVTSLTPSVAGATDAGSALLPFRDGYFGTAATNNFRIHPAATAAARILNIPDPLGDVNMAFTNPAAGLGQMFTNTSMTSPAITTDIHSTAAGGSSVGTALLPFGSGYFGTAATNNFRLLPAATAAARVINIPDPLGDVNMAFTNPAAGLGQMFTNTSLTSPAITTDIRSTAAGGSTVGTALLPFGSGYFGTAATNNFHILPAATAAARVINIPDPLGDVNMAFTNPAAGLGQMFTNTSMTSPAITTDIHSTAAGGSTVGTALLPFGSAYLGTAATNNLRIVPAGFAAAVAATVDDPGIAAVKLPTVVRGNATFTAALIAAGACGGVVTVGAAGLAATSTVTASLNAAPDAESRKGLTFWAYPTAGNVNILVCNGTAGALTPAADLVFNWTAILP